jgi:hypothetical protein
MAASCDGFERASAPAMFHELRGGLVRQLPRAFSYKANSSLSLQARRCYVLHREGLKPFFVLDQAGQLLQNTPPREFPVVEQDLSGQSKPHT